jgi:hypothetical protein
LGATVRGPSPAIAHGHAPKWMTHEIPERSLAARVA